MDLNQLDFEEEILNFQPDHNYIYETLGNENQQIYPRPQSHLDRAATAKEYREKYEKTLSQSDQAKLKVITAVQTIAKTKPIGEQPTLADWDTNDNIEKEVVAMIQYCGISPHNDSTAFGEKHTRQTTLNNSNVGIRVAHSGSKSIPLLFDDSFFKLRPRKSATSDTNQNEVEIIKDLNNSVTNYQIASTNTIAPENSTNVTSNVKSSGYNASTSTIALKNAIAASHKPPKNSIKVDNSSKNKKDIEVNSTNYNGGMNYANALKYQNNVTTTTKQNANPFLSSKTLNVLDKSDPSNKYYTPKELYLMKKQSK